MEVYAGLDPRLALGDVAVAARRVEALGYDGVHVAETVHDSLLVALLALQATERITVRTSVTLAFVRSPTLVAYTAWDLAKVSGGRFELGLGTQIRQNIEDRYAMPYGDPVARLRDYLDALDALYAAFAAGEPVAFASEHYTITRLQPYFNPGPDATVAAPATWLGGVNPRICRLAGERAAGFVTHPTNSSPRYLDEQCRPHLRAGAAAAGRDPDAVRVIAGTAVITGPTDADVARERERQRELFGFLLSTPAYRRTLELFGWAALAADLRALIRAERWQDLPSVVTDEVLDTLAPAARYDDLPALLLARYRERSSGILLALPSGPAADEAFGGVIAALRSG